VEKIVEIEIEKVVERYVQIQRIVEVPGPPRALGTRNTSSHFGGVHPLPRFF